jgi:site-specific DNA recombinase
VSTERGGSASRSVRCALYTRKSTTEGLDSGFSTLDAQREACEHYVRSQAAQGWDIVPERYDDGGFTGGNLDRPALRRLLDDIERGAIDAVVVYKVDRLSRSLLDFARLMERFEKHGVGFVSITQNFDTAGSMGRLMLNVLLSFAQFERELISERTRDKIQAARRRGKWTGGKVVLGYAIDPVGRRLKVVPEEARLVRLIFDLYLKTRSICAVTRKLRSLGHVQTRYGKGGAKAPGRPWDKNSVHRVLRNPLYIGKVRAKDGSLHPGEHEPIVTLETFEHAGASLDDRTTGGVHQSRKAEYLLTGLLRCGPCQAAMTSAASRGRNQRRYRYYRCCREQREGLRCPTGLLAAEEIERAVVTHIKGVATRNDLRERVVAHVASTAGRTAQIQEARQRVEERLGLLGAEARRLLDAFGAASSGGKLMAIRLGEIETEMDLLRHEKADLDSQMAAGDAVRHQGEHVTTLLDSFEEVWDALVPAERCELLHLVVKEVVVDLQAGGLRIALHDLSDAPSPLAQTQHVA